MLFLGANVLSPIKQISAHIGKLTGAYCAHAYIVNSHFYDRLLNYNFKKFKIFDEYLFHEMRNPNNNIYTVLPIVSIQRDSFSDIESKDVQYRDVLINSYKDNLNKV